MGKKVSQKQKVVPDTYRAITMKKFTFTLCTISILTLSANAQHRIGADLGLGINSKVVNESSSRDTYLSFVFDPSYSYAINEKLELGASMTFGTFQNISKSKESNDFESVSSTKNRYSQFFWSINPSLRCRLVGHEKFGLWLESSVNLGVQQDANYATSDDVKVKEKSEYTDLHWGLNVNPVLTYQFTEHFRMDATLGFLGIGLNGYSCLNEGKAQYSVIDFGAHLANGSITNLIDHYGTIAEMLSDDKAAGGSFIAKRVDFKIGFIYTF